jgi:hypothetical protein
MLIDSLSLSLSLSCSIRIISRQTHTAEIGQGALPTCTTELISERTRESIFRALQPIASKGGPDILPFLWNLSSIRSYMDVNMDSVVSEGFVFAHAKAANVATLSKRSRYGLRHGSRNGV